MAPVILNVGNGVTASLLDSFIHSKSTPGTQSGCFGEEKNLLCLYEALVTNSSTVNFFIFYITVRPSLK